LALTSFASACAGRFRLRRLCCERTLVDDVEKIALFSPRAVGKAWRSSSRYLGTISIVSGACVCATYSYRR